MVTKTQFVIDNLESQSLVRGGEANTSLRNSQYFLTPCVSDHASLLEETYFLMKTSFFSIHSILFTANSIHS